MNKYGVVPGEESEPAGATVPGGTVVTTSPGVIDMAMLAQLDAQLAKRRQLKSKNGIAVGPSVGPSGKAT